MNIQHNTIQEKIYEIYTSINTFTTKDIGLLTGNSGISLFYFYYGQFLQKDECGQNAMQSISDCVEQINSNTNQYSFCAGLAGFLWSLSHVSSANFIEKEDIIDLQDSFDAFLYKVMLNEIKLENFDYLHGAIGLGLYFIERSKNNKNVEIYLIELLNEIEKKSIKDSDGSIKWLSIIEQKTELQAYNLSLSHGITSFIVFFAKLVKHNICVEKANNMLNKSLQFLLKNIKDSSKNEYYFPSYISVNSDFPIGGRLAWCYNDLGTANVLFWVSQIINDNHLKQLSIDILLHHSTTTNLIKARIADAGLCHGTAGIAHIYNRMYRNTGIEKFKETHEFWIGETLKMAKFKDGLAGYKAYHGTDEGYVNEYGLLEGIAGIGLALLASVSDEDPSWDECLLLS